MAFAKAAYAWTKAEDRPFLLNEWGNAQSGLGGPPEPLALYRQALKLKPDYWIGYNNVINSEWILGDEEGAWRTGGAIAQDGRWPPWAGARAYYQN